MSKRYIKGSVFVERGLGSNARIGTTHSELMAGAGLLRHTGDVIVERADCRDLAHCLFAFIATDEYGTAQRLGVMIEEDVP